MPTRQHGSGGQQIDSKTFDPSFVQPGTTTRDEVLAKLSSVNTGHNDPHFFWGRWATSKWGYWWIVVAPSPNGGGGTGGGDAKRMWRVHNILITFDDHGIATSTQLMDDGPPLWRELNKQVASSPSLDLTKPLSFATGKYGDQQITLSPEWIGVERSRGKLRSMRVSPTKVSRITHTGVKDKRNNPGTSCHVLHFSEKTAFGKKINICTDGVNLFATFQYLHQYAPAYIKLEAFHPKQLGNSRKRGLLSLL
jgi:hypothetical protein